MKSQGSDGRWHEAVMKLPPESKLGLKDWVQTQEVSRLYIYTVVYII